MAAEVPTKLPVHVRQYFQGLLANVLPETPIAQAQRPLRAADYARVSITPQVTEGHGMDTQPANTGELIRRRGWVHVGTFSDPATSGRTHRRRGLQNLLRYVKAGLIDVVVIDRIDRLYRNLPKLLETVKFFNDRGVRLVSVAEGIDFQTPWGKLVLYVLGALAEIYVDLLSREMSQGKRTRAKKGLHNGLPSTGYCIGRCSSCTDPNGKRYGPCYGGPDRNQGRALIPHPIESAAIEAMFEFYETGRYTDAQVADEINRRLS
jgi:DNA invertase Pin-like site-specific DNA recombinase